MSNNEFIPISNSEAWDLYLENLKLKEQIKELNLELSLTRNPIYCEDCGSCGEVGCCNVNRCLYLNAHQGAYDDLVKENEKLTLANIELNVELTLNKVLNEGRTIVVRTTFPDE